MDSQEERRTGPNEEKYMVKEWLMVKESGHNGQHHPSGDFGIAKMKMAFANPGIHTHLKVGKVVNLGKK